MTLHVWFDVEHTSKFWFTWWFDDDDYDNDDKDDVSWWCLMVPDFIFQYMYDFLEAVITSQTSKEEAYRKLEEMAKNQTETLSKLTKQVLACGGHSGGKLTYIPQYWLVNIKNTV